ncbi:hypothetical protein [Sinomicrobium sp. M5D2P17]
MAVIKTNRVLTLLGILSFWGIRSSYGQEVKTYNAPGKRCYSNTLFVKKAEDPQGVIVMDVQNKDIKTYAENNPLVTSGLFEAYNFLYIKILDEQSRNSASCYETITGVISQVYHIRKDAFYMIRNSSSDNRSGPNGSGDSAELHVIYAPVQDVEDIKNSIDTMAAGKEYKIPEELTEKQRDSIKMKSFKGNFDAELHYAPVLLTGNKFGLQTDFIGVFGLSFKKNIGEKNALVLNLNYSRANKDKVQESVISSGTKDTINTHALFGGELLYRTYIARRKQFRIFASGGAGFYSVNDVDLKKRKTTSVYRKRYESQYFTLLIEGGFEYRITPVLSVNSSVPLKYFISNKTPDLNTFSFGLNLGISFTLNTNRVLKNKNKDKDAPN